MTRTTLNKLTETEKLQLANRLTGHLGFGIDRMFDTTLIPASLHQGLLRELQAEGFIRVEAGRVYAGPEIPKSPEEQAVLNRRDALLRASPVGRRILGLDTGTSPDARAGGMSAERRAQLLGASGLGRGMLRTEAKASEAKKA